ncbi:uncharacterized protein cubi_01126 [Cryptosporidium ubiquitum]|uniref:Uncharacterized protein n=1 Tax=Cryptosporidium ubiquitum TaxID=857276 RepID=A0A1J4MJ46_9CRYT|nr:uncharacterized protein cubi_01126 [Cryptosporidium ubiquitum]OII74282.1 hypothetical protein cubi_01126 [Cryptosporidium ubiquitum]
MRESINSVHSELLPKTSLGAEFLPLNKKGNIPKKKLEPLQKENAVEQINNKKNEHDKKMPEIKKVSKKKIHDSSSSSSSNFSSPKIKKKPNEITSDDSASIFTESSKGSSVKINAKQFSRDKDEIKKEVHDIGKKVSNSKKLQPSENVPDDLRAQFELAVNKVRAYIEKEYIDRMCEIDSENAIKLQRELNKILQSERDALEREKFNFEKRLREEMEREMHATIEIAAVENKKKADVSLAEIRKDIESHYIARQKEIEQELSKKKELLEEEYSRKNAELEEVYNNKKNEYLEGISKRKKDLEENFEERRKSLESTYAERISALESQCEENLKIKLEAELAKNETKQQKIIIEKDKELIQGKVLMESLKEQLEKMTVQKTELENMSSSTISNMKNYMKELQDSSEIQKSQIGTLEKTVKALYVKEQETMELVNQANEKISNMMDLKEAKKIAYNSLLKGMAVQLLDETLRAHYKQNYLKKGFEILKKEISRPKIVSTNEDGKGLKGNDLTLFLLRKEQLSLFAENENLMSQVEDLRVKHLEELKKTQESFMMYKRDLERDSNTETNVALYETSMLHFACIINTKIKLQMVDAFWKMRTRPNKKNFVETEDGKKDNLIKPVDINNRDKILINSLSSLYKISRIKLISYSWRKIVLNAKFSSFKTLPTMPFNEMNNNKGYNIDSFYLRDFINSMGKNGVTNFAHQPNYYNKLPSVINVQNKAVFVPLRRDNPITYGTYFQYNKEILSESCVTGKPVGSYTNINFS